MIALLLVALFVLVLWCTWRAAVLVTTDGLGDVPPPRSHDHEPRPSWRV